MKRLTKRNAYIEIVFPIYLFLNLMTMTTFCYTPIGESSSLVVLIVKACRYLIYLISIVKFASSHYTGKDCSLQARIRRAMMRSGPAPPGRFSSRTCITSGPRKKFHRKPCPTCSSGRNSHLYVDFSIVNLSLWSITNNEVDISPP